MTVAAAVWESPGEGWPPLVGDEVHVWRVCVPSAASLVAAVQPTLATDEVARAKRFRFDIDRLTYTVGRGLLRSLLGGYLQRPATDLQFVTNQHGKPALAAGPDADRLQFNLSHSGDWVVFAVTWDRAVGVDVERHRPLTTLSDIARRFFSEREVEVLLGLAPDQRQESFFRCWSRKEAYIKAVGRGLGLPLDQFEVSLLPGEPARLVEARGEAAVPGPWGMAELDVAAGYAAAVAVRGMGWRLRCWEWPTG